MPSRRAAQASTGLIRVLSERKSLPKPCRANFATGTLGCARFAALLQNTAGRAC